MNERNIIITHQAIKNQTTLPIFYQSLAPQKLTGAEILQSSMLAV